uniref:Uncharacterized protein n=1 Tax=Lepeophtheirus salmonis TaxID=72036 RepID=A0A0K2VC94_LEPSM
MTEEGRCMGLLVLWASRVGTLFPLTAQPRLLICELVYCREVKLLFWQPIMGVFIAARF